MTREEELEALAFKCWSALLSAHLFVDDPNIKAEFARVDQECRKVLTDVFD